MAKMIDFTNCPNGFRSYGGSDAKKSIRYEGDCYMVKLPERNLEKKNPLQTSHVNNVLSEYIGSHIIASLGIETHDTILGTYNNNIAVACRDFKKDGDSLLEFSWMMLSYYDKSQIGRFPTYHQLYDVMQNHPLLSDMFDQAIARYWDTFVADSLIGNFDRHKGNWGYLANEKMSGIRLAPVYDCGSSLYPGLSEDGMKYVLSREDEIEKRIYDFPKAALNELDTPKKEKKIGYLEMLSSGKDPYCTEALLRIYPRIDLDQIFNFIENIPILSDQRIEFYEAMLKERKELILDRAMEIQGKRLNINDQDRANCRDFMNLEDETDNKVITPPINIRTKQTLMMEPQTNIDGEQDKNVDIDGQSGTDDENWSWD